MTLSCLRMPVLLGALMTLAIGIGINSQVLNQHENVIFATYQVEWAGAWGIETGGNGFILCDEHGEPLVGVTAYHVATDASWQPLKMLQVRQYGQYIAQEEVFYHDTKADVAFFTVPTSARSCIRIASTSTPEITFFSGLAVAIQNDRGHESIFWSLPYFDRWGKVTSCCQNLNILVHNEIGDRWSRMLIANVTFSPGVSGSPVVYSNYSLAGIAVGMLNRNNGAVIVPAEDVLAALERAHMGTGRSAQTAPPARAQRTKFQKPGPFALPEINTP